MLMKSHRSSLLFTIACIASLARQATATDQSSAASAQPGSLTEMSCSEFRSQQLDSKAFWVGLKLGALVGTAALRLGIENACQATDEAPLGVGMKPDVCPQTTNVGRELFERETTGYSADQLHHEVLAECAKDETQKLVQAVIAVLYEKVRFGKDLARWRSQQRH